MRPKPTTSTVDETHQAICKKWQPKLSSPKPTKTDHDIQLSYSSTLELCNESCTFDAGSSTKIHEIPKKNRLGLWDYDSSKKSRA